VGPAATRHSERGVAGGAWGRPTSSPDGPAASAPLSFGYTSVMLAQKIYDKRPPRSRKPVTRETIAGCKCEHYVMGDEQDSDVCAAKGRGMLLRQNAAGGTGAAGESSAGVSGDGDAGDDAADAAAETAG
jgi:hypothetical protein